jgi:hypothetical protein
LAKFVLTLIALIGLAQLIIWHSLTPMLLPLILISVSLTPALASLLRRAAKGFSLAISFLRFASLAAIALFTYWLIEADQIFGVMVFTLHRLLTTRETVAALPNRLFEITLLDILQVMLVIHGRDIMLIALTALGVLVVWHFRRPWEHLLNFYVYLLLIYVTFGMLIVAAFSGADYGRFIVASLVVIPFFAGPALWWLDKRLLVKILYVRWLGRLIWLLLIVLLIGVSTVQFFRCQPLVPTAKSLVPGYPDEYVVWLHTVNTAYQQRMLSFGESHTNPETCFAIDIEGVSQFVRYFGRQAAYRRGLDSPLHWHKPVDANVKLFLLHWPGRAGALGEQVEQRSIAKLSELRQTPGWGLIYDNGESFILQVR